MIHKIINVAERVAARHGGCMPECCLSVSLVGQTDRAFVYMQHVGMVGRGPDYLTPEEVPAALERLLQIQEQDAGTEISTLQDATEGRR